MKHVAIAMGVLSLTATIAASDAAAQQSLEEQVLRAITGAGDNDENDDAPSGALGLIESLRILETTNDDYSKMHGALVVKYYNDEEQLFRWGGSYCPGRNLTDANKQVLATAFASGMKIRVETKNGQGGAQCIVGFELSK
ncbi:MAG: hypothetical protein AAGC77_00765 [Pseudomonadota bacterium]